MKPCRCRKIRQAKGSIRSHATFNSQSGWRNQNNAIQIHPLIILQLQSQSRHPSSTITFPNQILWRCPTIGASYESTNPICQVFNVRIYPKEFCRNSFFYGRPRITRIDRIYKDNICNIKNGIRVFFDSVGLNWVAFIVNIE